MAANPSPLQQQVLGLSEAIVLCDLKDLQELARIHGQLQEVRDCCAGDGRVLPRDLAQSALDLIEKIVLQDADDERAALNLAIEAVSKIQASVVDGRADSELTGAAAPPEKAPAPAPAATPATPDALSFNDDAILAEFLSRQPAVLDEMETLILGVERVEIDREPRELKHLIHTLKGESALLGLEPVERSCHGVEDALATGPACRLVDVLLDWRDWLARYFKARAGQGAMPPAPDAILNRMRAQLDAPPETVQVKPAPLEPVAPAPDPAPAAPAEPAEARPAGGEPLNADPSLLGEFIAEAVEHLENADAALLTLEVEHADTEAINAVFRAFHTIKGVAGFLALTDLGSLAHEAESLLDGARKGTLSLEGPVIDVVFEASDCLKRMVNALRGALETGLTPDPEPTLPALIARLRDAVSGRLVSAPSAVPELAPHPNQRLGDILVGEGLVDREQVEKAFAEQQQSGGGVHLGEMLIREHAANPQVVAHALRSQKAVTPQQPSVQVRETVKVDAERLDALVEMIGELVIAESMVSQASEMRSNASAKLVAHLKELDKITRELQEMGTSLRMIPLRSTFQKMARLVRDVARKAGKQVEFVMNGEDTELDKMVVDRIGDPLIHMIRNAVDHGLEPDGASRVAAGKPEVGRVELRAFHRGGSIYIEIQDDGRGLDREAILAKARDRGLVGPDEHPSDREIFNLIFHPGLSTAKKVTDVSGRGVGMDVVKKNVEALRGQIEIQSAPGKGSTFSICLPLTLAIIDGMVLRVGGERYITPTLSIQTTIRPEPGMISTVHGRGELLRLQGELIPMFRLDRLFNITTAVQNPREAVIVIVENESRRIGLLADELLGQQQIVIKPLGDRMQHTPGLSGGAIMPDGQVSLILDVAGLIKLAHNNTAAMPAEAIPAAAAPADAADAAQ